MPCVCFALPYRFLLAVLFSVVPLAGCAALSSIQQTEQSQGGTWVQSPINRSSDAEDEATRAKRNRSAERNPRIRTVELSPTAEIAPPIHAGPAALAATLREKGEDWIGTRYRYGGTTRRGIDCSSFVQQLLRDALDIELPRTTASQQYSGEAVSRDELLPADLVFFRRRGVRHVGIYLGNGEFIHASSGRGVIISNLTEGYYRRHFWKARRVIGNPQSFLPDEKLRQPTDIGDMIRPGSVRSSNRPPEQTGNGNPHPSW